MWQGIHKTKNLLQSYKEKKRKTNKALNSFAKLLFKKKKSSVACSHEDQIINKQYLSRMDSVYLIKHGGTLAGLQIGEKNL